MIIRIRDKRIKEGNKGRGMGNKKDKCDDSLSTLPE